MGAHGRGADHGLARPRQGGRHAPLPDRRRPRHPDLAGQPGRPRAARAPVDGRPQGPARATPTGWSSTSTPASRPGCTSAARWRCWSRDALAERDLGCQAGAPAAARACTSTPTCRGGCRTATERPRWPRRSPRSSRASTPKLVTATMTKARRPGKVFLDWSQNSGSKTTSRRTPCAGGSADRRHAARLGRGRGGRRGPDLALEQFRFDQVLERVARLGDVFEA